MENKIDISFCVPVYNVATYLERCLDSILAVKGVTFEVICINDCSTDNSLDILNFYALKDNRVKVKTLKENLGVSYSRNTAMNLANGKYIWFVDPDDMIVPDSAKVLFDAAEKENADSAWGNCLLVNDLESNYTLSVKKDYCVIENSYDDLNAGKIYAFDGNGNCVQSVWCGMFNRKFLNDNKIAFCEGIRYSEDLPFNYLFQYYFNVMVKVDTVCYFYRQRGGSLMHSFSEKTQKMKYESSYNNLVLYNNYLENGIYNSIESRKMSNIIVLKAKISIMSQNLILWLATIRDKKYIREQFKKLKKEGIYPYKFRKEAIREGGASGLLLYLLPLKPFFLVVTFFIWV